MLKFLRCAAITLALAAPNLGTASTTGYSFNVWESVCRPSSDVADKDAGACFVEALDFYVTEFAPKAFRFGSELHCHDDIEMFWTELDGTRERFEGYLLPTEFDWRYVVSQLMHYSGQICPDISR